MLVLWILEATGYMKRPGQSKYFSGGSLRYMTRTFQGQSKETRNIWVSRTPGLDTWELLWSFMGVAVGVGILTSFLTL